MPQIFPKPLFHSDFQKEIGIESGQLLEDLSSESFHQFSSEDLKITRPTFVNLVNFCETSLG